MGKKKRDVSLQKRFNSEDAKERIKKIVEDAESRERKEYERLKAKLEPRDSM